MKVKKEDRKMITDRLRGLGQSTDTTKAAELMEYLYVEDGMELKILFGLCSVDIIYEFHGETRRKVDIHCCDFGAQVTCTWKSHVCGRLKESVLIPWDEMHQIVNIVKLMKNEYVWRYALDRKGDGIGKYLHVHKACLFTGAFNPPTVAHSNMVNIAKMSDDFDFFIYAASNQNFLAKKQRKTGGGKAFSENERLRMLLLMTRDQPDVLVYGIEHGYTYDVLTDTRNKYNIKKLYFALGSDKLKEIGRWGNHNNLLKEFCFYVVQRNEHTQYIKDECAKLFVDTDFTVSLHENDYYNVSATQVREAIEKGEDYKDLVTEEIYEELQLLQHNVEYDKI